MLVGQIKALYGDKAVRIWSYRKEGCGLEVIRLENKEVLHEAYPPSNIPTTDTLGMKAITLAKMLEILSAQEVIEKFKS